MNTDDNAPTRGSNWTFPVHLDSFLPSISFLENRRSTFDQRHFHKGIPESTLESANFNLTLKTPSKSLFWANTCKCLNVFQTKKEQLRQIKLHQDYQYVGLEM